jgi:ligand-binding sensor domain-containing protein
MFDGDKNIITGLREAVDGGYWVSTIGGGLYRLQNGSFDAITIPHSKKCFRELLFQTSYTIQEETSAGYAGAGVYRFNQRQYDKKNNLVRSFDHFNTQSTPALNHDFIMALERITRVMCGLGTWSGGLNKITPTGEVIQYSQPDLKKVPLVALACDLSGVLWVGTRGNGLYRVKARGQDVDIQIFQQGNDSTKFA